MSDCFGQVESESPALDGGFFTTMLLGSPLEVQEVKGVVRAKSDAGKAEAF